MSNGIRQNEELKDFVDSLEEEWRSELPALETDAIPVIARIVRMSYYIARKVDANFARFNLTRGEFEVLAVLTRNPTKDITPKILQTKVLITSGGLANRINRLEDKGLIIRLPDPNDRRGVIVKATDKGRELTLKVVVSHMEVEKTLIEGLSVEDQTMLAELLKKLLLTQHHQLNSEGLN